MSLSINMSALNKSIISTDKIGDIYVFNFFSIIT